jgi:hypothetical protein
VQKFYGSRCTPALNTKRGAAQNYNKQKDSNEKLQAS